MIDSFVRFTTETGTVTKPESIMSISVIKAAVDNLLSVGTQILNFITDNTLLLLCFSGVLIGVGCKVIRRIKRTAIK